MAGFCKQCSEELFGDDYRDMADIAEPGETIFLLCEECGYPEVDSNGSRVEPKENAMARFDHALKQTEFLDTEY